MAYVRYASHEGKPERLAVFYYEGISSEEERVDRRARPTRHWDCMGCECIKDLVDMLRTVHGPDLPGLETLETRMLLMEQH